MSSGLPTSFSINRTGQKMVTRLEISDLGKVDGV